MGNDFKDLFGDWKPDDDRPSDPDHATSEPENRNRAPITVKEVEVVNVFEAVNEPEGGLIPTVSQTFVLLKDRSNRKFRIFVLRDMAMAISMALSGEQPDRPFTHDLLKNIVERLGATVERITIDDLWRETFYAKITVTRGTDSFDIDARPSDAIAIGLRFRAPIYVAESVLEAAQRDE